MPGINLSQSAALAEKSESRISASSKAVYASLSILLLSGAAYGVLWYFSYSLDKQEASTMQSIQDTKAKYTSAAVLRVAKFFIKSDAVVTKRSLPDVNPQDELQVMSRNILPQIVLDSYNEDFSTNSIIITGEAKTFLQVAQQMKVFQKSGNFSSIVLSGPLTQDDKGKVTFSLNLTRVSDQKKN